MLWYKSGVNFVDFFVGKQPASALQLSAQLLWAALTHWRHQLPSWSQSSRPLGGVVWRLWVWICGRAKSGGSRYGALPHTSTILVRSVDPKKNTSAQGSKLPPAPKNSTQARPLRWWMGCLPSQLPSQVLQSPHGFQRSALKKCLKFIRLSSLDATTSAHKTIKKCT